MIGAMPIIVEEEELDHKQIRLSTNTKTKDTPVMLSI